MPVPAGPDRQECLSSWKGTPSSTRGETVRFPAARTSPYPLASEPLDRGPGRLAAPAR
jgi:hypothetical protein